MTITEFKELDLTGQADATWQGVFIEHRKTPDATISLYCLGSFFVEVWYSPDHGKFIKFHAFESPSLVDLYNTQTNN